MTNNGKRLRTTPNDVETLAEAEAAKAEDDMTQIAVPDKSIATTYVHRKYSNMEEFGLFDYARQNRQNVLLFGPTGAGKTSAAMAYAAEHGLYYCNVPSHVSVTPDQLFGKYVPNDDGIGFHWQDGPVTRIVKEGGVLLLNEVNFMPDRVATVLFGLLDRRREIVLQDHEGEIVKAADDLLIVADMNPDYAGTRPLNAAFRNRFAVQLVWDYDDNVETKLVPSNSLRSMAKQLRAYASKGEMETPIGTNMLMEFSQAVNVLGYDVAVLLFVNHFTVDERSVVQKVMATHEFNLKSELIPKDDSQINDTDEVEDDDEWNVINQAEDWISQDSNW